MLSECLEWKGQNEMTDVLRVFIGSGEASLIERKVLQYSIQKNCKCPVEVCVFNGTHDALEHPGKPPQRLNMPLSIKYLNITEFSSYRFLIPDLCNFQGRAVFIDSDMLCLRDISAFLTMNMNGAQFLSRRAYDKDAWGPSVMLIDNSACRFDLQLYFDEISNGRYKQKEFMQFQKAFLAVHPFKIGELDKSWNDFDNVSESTNIIHYTNLRTQPWKYTGHPFGDIWFTYFNEARHEGWLTEEDIDKSLSRAYVRANIREGNDPAVGIKPAAKILAHAIKSKLTRAMGRR
jgi:hypothetical protein